jgi:hypothetical protein
MQSPAEILGLDKVEFIEPSFANLPDIRFNLLLEEVDGDQGRLLIDEESDPVCMAVHTGKDVWVAGCFHLRKPTAALITRFEDLGGDIFQEERDIWEAAVRGYYSREIAFGITPALEDLNPARSGFVDSLVGEVWGGGTGQSCLDCGCGSGVGSLVLRNRGFSPLSCDNDPSLLSLGFAKGRLIPEETMWIDASLLKNYIGHCDAGLGLMFGEIHDFNAGMWEQITMELIMLTDRCLITLGTEQEALRIRQWAHKCGANTDIFENPRDPIYDRWVCTISP